MHACMHAYIHTYIHTYTHSFLAPIGAPLEKLAELEGGAAADANDNANELRQ